MSCIALFSWFEFLLACSLELQSLNLSFGLFKGLVRQELLACFRRALVPLSPSNEHNLYDQN